MDRKCDSLSFDVFLRYSRVAVYDRLVTCTPDIRLLKAFWVSFSFVGIDTSVITYI